MKNEVVNNIWVVIAAFNEAKKIGSVVRGLKKEGYHNVIVVDDGSIDATALSAKKAGAIVYRHAINRGQGASLQTGIDAALANGAAYIVTFDADGQHDKKEIKELLMPVRSGEAEVVLGSRFLHKKSNVPWLKRFVLKCGIIFTRIFSGIQLTDAHNGFRAFSRNAAQKIRIHHDRMEHASEIVEEIHKQQIPFKEVPVTIKYTNYSMHHGQSPLNSIRIAGNLLLRKLAR